MKMTRRTFFLVAGSTAAMILRTGDAMHEGWRFETEIDDADDYERALEKNTHKEQKSKGNSTAERKVKMG